MFNQVYQNRRVLVTGHTGFKGSWLCKLLSTLGAEMCGVALPLDTEYSHFDLLDLPMRSEIADIRDLEKLKKIFSDFQPEIVFHLAAQPLVRLSYDNPVETFAANVMGTVNVLEACRGLDSLKAIVAISSDKCYENREQIWGYREDDAMGGYDPYSASKGCTELVISSYRRSFYNPADYGTKHHTLLASARAGNVIGGGDWAKDRLIPDIMRNAAAGRRTVIRSPHAVRPWQHVLEPLSGYCLLGEKLFNGDTSIAEGWNFGPDHSGIINVQQVVSALSRYWDRIMVDINPPKDQPHEAGLLCLDCSKAHYRLGWESMLSAEETFEMTVKWYEEFYCKGNILTDSQIRYYLEKLSSRERHDGNSNKQD